MTNGSQTLALNASQARDALAAFERLESFRQSTGRRLSLLAAVSEYVEAAAKLGGRALIEAVERYVRTVATVKRQDIAEAVEQFIASDEPHTKAGDGQRAQLSAKYAYNRAIMLRRFAATFPNTAVCDLAKEHVDAFFHSLDEFSPKSRNHHRAAVRQFFQWAVRKDYLPATHRLGEADGLRPERADTGEIAFYTPREFRALLEAADETLRPIIALAGLAGLRTVELLRLDWADLWRVPGHVEVTSGKSKTRQRRLVEIGPALSAWLQPYRSFVDGKLWTPPRNPVPRGVAQALREGGRDAESQRTPTQLLHLPLRLARQRESRRRPSRQLARHDPRPLQGTRPTPEAEQWFAVAPAPTANLIPLSALSRPPAQ